MKLKIQTLTGKISEIDVPQHSTIRDVKREIYKLEKIAGAVRILKGQEVLPDGSTLEQHNITEGSTVNIVVKPEQEINISVVLGPKRFGYMVKDSVSFQDLKKLLLSNKQIALLPREISFKYQGSAEENRDDVIIEDETLPLHHYNVQNNALLQIVKSHMMLNIMSQRGENFYAKFNRRGTVRELKQKTMAVINEGARLLDVSLFTKHKDEYQKLDDCSGDSLGDRVKDDDTIYVIEHRFFPDQNQMRVYHRGPIIGKVGANQDDTDWSVKLRAQEQFGFPARDFLVEGPTDNFKLTHHQMTDVYCLLLL